MIKPIQSEEDFLELAKELYEASPKNLGYIGGAQITPKTWDELIEFDQDKWIAFAKFAYGTIITALSEDHEHFYCKPCDTKFSVARGLIGLCPTCEKTDGARSMEDPPDFEETVQEEADREMDCAP